MRWGCKNLNCISRAKCGFVCREKPSRKREEDFAELPVARVMDGGRCLRAQIFSPISWISLAGTARGDTWVLRGNAPARATIEARRAKQKSKVEISSPRRFESEAGKRRLGGVYPIFVF